MQKRDASLLRPKHSGQMRLSSRSSRTIAEPQYPQPLFKNEQFLLFILWWKYRKIS
jgi:hypothetical protein